MSTSRLAVVIGCGRSGAACARVLVDDGWRVRVVDTADTEATRAVASGLPDTVEVRLGGYGAADVTDADMVCPSPGVRWDDPVLDAARAAGAEVRSEIDLVFERCPAPIVGITGTNGKTTTTALTGAVIAAGGATVHVGGNIGEPMLDRLTAVRPDDWVVLELSSFQLESASRPRCRLATVLNLTPDHLDRHGSMESYRDAKLRVVTYVDPAGAVALNGDDAVTLAMAAASPARVLLFGRDIGRRDGVTVRDGEVVLAGSGRFEPVLPVGDIPLFGAHNVGNVMAAVALGGAAGVSAAAMAEAVRAFRPVSHRLEPVLDEGGVLWVDDSKATNVDAAATALRAFPDRPIIWIGGGGSKGVGPEGLATEVATHARHAVLQGATGPEVDAALAARGFEARTLVATLEDAVRAARDLAEPGDVVLLAPGYTSFDQFTSYQERGDAFAALVRRTAQPVAGQGRDT